MIDARTERIRQALLSRIEERHKADLRAVERVVELIDDDPELLGKLLENQRRGSVNGDSTPSGITNVDIVVNALKDSNGWTGAPAIAKATGLTESAVRTVLYTKKGMFKKKKIGPRKVAWRLAPGQEVNSPPES